MHIELLKLAIDESTLNQILARHAPRDGAVTNLNIKITEKDITLAGKYAVFGEPPPDLVALGTEATNAVVGLGVGFATHWTPTAIGQKLKLTLGSVDVLLVVGKLLRGLVLDAVRDLTNKDDALSMEEDTLVADLGRLLQRNGIDLQLNFRQAYCLPGTLVIESAAL